MDKQVFSTQPDMLQLVIKNDHIFGVLNFIKFRARITLHRLLTNLKIGTLQITQQINDKEFCA